ncbi:cytochrome P450 monooxygenase [Sparassis latifolia]
MVSVLLQALLIAGTTWTLWLCVRRLLVKSPLDNLLGPPSNSFWFGHLSRFMTRHGWEFQMDVAQNYGPVVNLKGFLGQPILYVYDPKALHNIIVKDHYIYEEPPAFLTSNHLNFGPSLLSTVGDVHRKQRKMLNPVFSIAHMRHMLPIFYKVVGNLSAAMGSRVTDGPQELDMLGWMGRTALELIGQGGLGYSFDPLVRDAADEYGNALKEFLPVLFSLDLLLPSLPYLVRIGSPAFRRRVVNMIPSRRVQRMKAIIDTMYRRSQEIFNAKKAALAAGDKAVTQQVGEGKDIMSILIRANMDAKLDEDKLSEEELLAQMSTLTFAATDTTSNTLARILGLLAEHTEVQERLRHEILTASRGVQPLTYDELMGLPYLDAVCRETMRVHPPVTILSRQARKDIILPFSQPIRGKNGQLMSEILVPNGTQIFLGITGSNLNKALWGEDALEWKPKRWLSPLPDAVTDAHIPGVYSHLMSFLGGGRACIGFKFSEMELKVVLTTLLPKFTFELSGKPIVWNMAGVRYPTVGKENSKPEMPLKVGLYKTPTA